MGIAFALLFPSGALMIRLLSFTGLVWVHAAVQMLAYALALAGMGLGIYIAIWYVLSESYSPISSSLLSCKTCLIT